VKATGREEDAGDLANALGRRIRANVLFRSQVRKPMRYIWRRPREEETAAAVIKPREEGRA
jgi:hypothetical protein